MRRFLRPLTASALLVLTLFAAGCAPSGPFAPATSTASMARLEAAYVRLPLHFEENRGQLDRDIRFVARTSTGRIQLAPGGFVLSADGASVRLSFAAGRSAAVPEPLEALPGRVNYYQGPDPKRWYTDIPTFARVRYAEVYPGIDVIVYGNQRQLEYDFVVAPGADPNAIRIRIEGADALALGADGDLTIRRGDRTILQRAPIVYQEHDGRRVPVTARYVLRRGHDLAFEVGDYDRTRPLVIDPVIVYSTRIGHGDARAIAVDSAGYAYFTGENSGGLTNEYPTVNAAFAQPKSNFPEIFVTKLSPNGDALVYSTYIGSFGTDAVNGIATDGAGNAYITGKTHPGYPTTAGAFQPTVQIGEDGSVSFVTKFGPTGAVAYSTFLNGTTFDNPLDTLPGGACMQGSGNGIAVDGSGHAYVVGYTSTSDFPTTPGAYLPAKPTVGSRCLELPAGYLTKLSPGGSSLVYSTYLDGNGRGLSVAVDAAGSAYVGGIASAPSAPPGTLTASLAASGAMTGYYIAKFSAAGLPTQTTTIGAWPESIAVGSDGSIYVAGGTTPDFKTVNAFQPASAGSTVPVSPGEGDGFAARMNAGGTAWLWATYIGGSGLDAMTAIAAASDGSAWVAGYTSSADFPFKESLRAKTQPMEAVLLKLSGTGGLLFSSALGDGFAFGAAVGGGGHVYVTGTAGTDFLPTSPGAYSNPPSSGCVVAGPDASSQSAACDVFVLKLSDTPASPPTGGKPTVTITKPSNGAWTGNSINIGVSGTDDTGLQDIKLWGNRGVIATIPCSGTTCSGSVWWSTGALPAAAYEVNAVATDISGNQTISTTLTIYKNAKSPVVPSGAVATGGGGTPATLTAAITSPAGGASVNGAVTVTMAAGNASGTPLFTLKLDNTTVLFSGSSGTATASTVWSTQTVPSGIHTLDLTVTDGAGRTATHSIAVIVGPPLAAAITSPATGATVSGAVTVTMTATNAVGGKTFHLQGNGIAILHQTTPASTVTATWNTTDFANGAHVLQLTLTDGGGRTASASINVTVNNPSPGGGDTTKPAVGIHAPANGAWTGNSIRVTASASDDAAVKDIKLWGNGAVFGTIPCSGTTCSGTVSWITGSLPPAAYEVNAVATDTAGHQMVSATVIIYKSAKSPVVPSGAGSPGGGGTGGGTAPLTATVTAPANGATVSGTVTVSMAAGNASGTPVFTLEVDNTNVLFSGSNGGASTASASWSTQGFSNGAHTLDLTATDGAGRTATSTVTVTVSNPPPSQGGGDASAPSVAITSPSNGAWTGNSIGVTASATDNGTVATLKYYGNGTLFAEVTCGTASCTSKQWWLTGSLPRGKHTITVVATDNAGMQTTSAPVVINK